MKDRTVLPTESRLFSSLLSASQWATNWQRSLHKLKDLLSTFPWKKAQLSEAWTTNKQIPRNSCRIIVMWMLQMKNKTTRTYHRLGIASHQLLMPPFWNFPLPVTRPIKTYGHTRRVASLRLKYPSAWFYVLTALTALLLFRWQRLCLPSCFVKWQCWLPCDLSDDRDCPVSSNDGVDCLVTCLMTGTVLAVPFRQMTVLTALWLVWWQGLCWLSCFVKWLRWLPCDLHYARLEHLLCA